MKKILKDWNKFEIILLFSSIITVSGVGIYCKADILTTICSIIGIITALLLAKGKNLGQIVGIVLVILYSIISFNNRFYGEVIIYIFIMLPMYVLGIISWIKHQNKKTNTVELNEIKKQEWMLISITSIIAFVLIYFILKAFDTNQLLISSLSVIDSLFAVYLMARRSKYGFYFYIVNDIILILLWGIPVFTGNILLLPMLFNPIINLLNDIYGIYNWRRLEKDQMQ